MTRYAIYLAPPQASALEDFARSWLGRDHVSGQTVSQLSVPDIAPERVHEITRSPRHYGFHATMKAPFELAENTSIEQLEKAASTFAAARRSFSIQLEPRSLKGFLALVPAGDPGALNALAADCVRDFEPFRAPLSPSDIERRRRSSLTPKQDAQMLRWGYPYVFGDFHFHMTLTERLNEPERSNVLEQISKLTQSMLAKPVPVTEIAIYGQSRRDEPFVLRRRLPFATDEL